MPASRKPISELAFPASEDPLELPAEAAESAVEPVSHCRTCRCFKTAPKRRRRPATGIKRSGSDIIFSRKIRERDGWTCQRCGKRYEPPTSALHCAHMYSRRIKATRWDKDNACALCFGCHQYIDSHPNEKLAFFRELLGDSRFDALSARAHAKRDRRTA